MIFFIPSLQGLARLESIVVESWAADPEMRPTTLNIKKRLDYIYKTVC